MLTSYFLIAWRTLLKNKLFSCINITGLALSMSVCMIVLIRITDGFHYDTFHRDEQRIFRINSRSEKNDTDVWKLASSPLPLAETLRKDTLIFQDVLQLYPVADKVTQPKENLDLRGAFTTSSFFNVFSFSLEHGDVRTALANPNSIVLSKSCAERFFGTASALGKQLTFEKLGIFQVTGILASPPSKSHIAFDALLSSGSVSYLEKQGGLPALSDKWDTFEKAYTYVKVKPGIDEPTVKHSMDVLSDDFNKHAKDGKFYFYPQSVTRITPSDSDLYNELSRGPTRGALLAEGAIVLIILLAASFNYTNLSVARALRRGKEVGIRKLAGAQRWQIFFQYITEAIILAFISLFLAQVIVGLILEYRPFNDGYEMVPAVEFNFEILAIFVAFAIMVGLVAGSAPAWLLSSFQPVRVLRNLGTEKIFGNVPVRKALLILQFALSMVILIFLSAFYNQFEYVAEADPGFSRENLLIIPLHEKQEMMSTELKKISGIRDVGFTSQTFGRWSHAKLSLSRQKDEVTPLSINYYACDNRFIDLMGLEIIAGSNFREGSGPDAILLNEKAVIALGFSTIEKAVGAQLHVDDTTVVKVHGIVKNFYNEGFGNAIKPLAFRPGMKEGLPTAVVLVEPASASSTLSEIQASFKKLIPDHPFKYEWFDRNLEESNDQSAEISMLGFLGFMTVTIALMGLLGLVVYTVETRRKEISIRKIAGARVDQLLYLLSGGFVTLLLIAGAVAVPVGFILSEMFLMGFVNRVPFGVPDLALCFLFLLSGGLVTILSQTYRASTENPAKNLRSE